MRISGQAFIGLTIILIGVLFLIGNVFNVNVGAFCWPVGLIFVGVWLIFRPQMLGPETRLTQKLLGDIERRGVWQVQDEEFWAFIGEVDLDMTQADIPLGETHLRLLGFIGEIDLLLPEDVGVSVSATGFISSVKLAGHKEDGFIMPLHWQSDNYKAAERKIRLGTTCFIAEVKVRQV